MGIAHGPERRLAFATLVTSLGNGMYFAVGAIFLVRCAGLSAADVGIGLAVGGGVGMLASLWIGRVADRLGARDVLVGSLLLEAAGAFLLLSVHSLAVFVPIACLAKLGRQSSNGVRAAYIGSLGGVSRRTALRAQQRAVSNLGNALGALAAAPALAIDRPWAYETLLGVNALTFVVCAAVVLTLPRERAAATSGARPSWKVTRDRRYVGATALEAVVSLEYPILVIGIPLWIASQTEAPRWVVSGVLIINMVGVMALQQRVSRGLDGPSAAARGYRRAAWLFAVAWAVLALCAHTGATVATLLLLAVAAVHTLAELWHASASFEVSYALADELAPGEYQAFYGLAAGISEALAPVLFAVLCIGWGPVGWLVLGAAVAAAGSASSALVKRTGEVPAVSDARTASASA